MNTYKVWYRKDPTFRTDYILTEDMIKRTHTLVGKTVAHNLEDLFVKMQGENWSPNGEARPLIERLNLHHTSMSVGDVAECGEQFWQVDFSGWLPVYDTFTFITRRLKTQTGLDLSATT